MTAAHYIALLLLSTAASGSREHEEIIEQNGPGVWHALAEIDLVERIAAADITDGLWYLTERGRVLVDHILGLPLPESVSAWRMPGINTLMPRGTMTVDVVVPLQKPGGLQWVDDETYVHTSAPVSLLPKVDIPTDPVALENLANELLNRGFGLNEVTETLKLSPAQAKAIFGAT